MEQGKPWPRDTTPQLQRIGLRQQLEPLQTVLHRAAEGQSSGLFSPVSMTSTIRAVREPLQQSARQTREPSVVDVSPSSVFRGPGQDIVVPAVAHISSGGWFDPSNWLFNIVYPRFQHMDLPELLQAYFTRDARPLYGENHTSTRGKRRRDTDDLDEESFSGSSSKKRSTENHKVQERDRRDRHRVLQKASDDCTPTVIFDLAEKQLSQVKELIKGMPQEETENHSSSIVRGGKGQSSSTAAKKTGKDDQLLSAALFSWLSGFVVLRLNQSRIEAEDKVQQLENELEEAHARRIEAEDRAVCLEVDNKYYAEGVSYLRQQLEQRVDSRHGSLASSSCAQPYLSPPTTSRKRPTSDVDRYFAKL